MSDMQILLERNPAPVKLEVLGVYDWPIWRPTVISPLSIRRLNPHSGFEQTQALYRIAAPSLP